MVWTAYGGWVIRGAGFLHASKANLHNTHYFCQQYYKCKGKMNIEIGICVYMWVFPCMWRWTCMTYSSGFDRLPRLDIHLHHRSLCCCPPLFPHCPAHPMHPSGLVSETSPGSPIRKKTTVKQVYYTPFRYNLHFTMSSLPTHTLLANS